MRGDKLHSPDYDHLYYSRQRSEMFITSLRSYYSVTHRVLNTDAMMVPNLFSSWKTLLDGALYMMIM